jgi:hypothetical protein
MDEISWRGMDIAETLATLPDEYQSVMGDVFRNFKPEDHLPLRYMGVKSREQEQNDEDRFLSAARVAVKYFSEKSPSAH